MTGCILRAGDIVHHEPTGEDWVVAYIDGEYLAWCGWPEGRAKVSDCWLKKSCTDEEHLQWLQEIAKSDGSRGRRARYALEALNNEQREISEAASDAIAERPFSDDVMPEVPARTRLAEAGKKLAAPATEVR